ncbi:MAG: acetylxylan esterase [Clostridia bacterium]|nr:acetylxylan esterase [Clostridia bacterium]
MNNARQKWLDALGTPEYEIKYEPPTLLAKYDCNEFDGELYRQVNGRGKTQRVIMAFPKGTKEKCPAVVVPFYIAEQLLGFDPADGRVYERYQKAPIMLDLIRRGYAVASADAYHLTYYESDREKTDFARWGEAAAVLRKDHPNWSGVGKLVSDTKLVIGALSSHPRVDAERMGIAGFSLGGKMAFYTGCLDDRIRAILAVDFGIGWDQTNWRDTWYWGDQLDELIAAGMEHSSLLGSAAPKPMCLLAGAYDNEESWEIMKRAPGYKPDDGRLKMISYPGGHFPTREALEEGYDFLDRWLK